MPEQYNTSTELDRAPVIEPGHTFGTVTEKISAIVLTRPASNGWFLGFGIAFMLTMMMLFAIGYLVLKGIGIWGVTIPIMWDVFAVSTYATISALFWFVGLIPDLATLRDRSDNHALKMMYGVLSFGWRGSARH